MAGDDVEESDDQGDAVIVDHDPNGAGLMKRRLLTSASEQASTKPCGWPMFACSPTNIIPISVNDKLCRAAARSHRYALLHPPP